MLRGLRESGTILLATLLALLAGCGGGSASSLTPSQSAVVAFSRALIAAAPQQRASLEAAHQVRSATAKGHADLAAAEQALGSYLSHVQAWRQSMERLPAANSDLTPIRAEFSEAARDEVQFVRYYITAVRGAGGSGYVNPLLAKQAEAVRQKLQSANTAAWTKLNALIGRLGGAAAFHGRIDQHALSELMSSLRQQAGG